MRLKINVKDIESSEATKVDIIIASNTTRELDVDNSFDLLHNCTCGFEFSPWESLAQYLHIPHKERKQLKNTIRNEQYNLVLEDSLNYWITHHTSQPSWEELIKECVERCCC